MAEDWGLGGVLVSNMPVLPRMALRICQTVLGPTSSLFHLI